MKKNVLKKVIKVGVVSLFFVVIYSCISMYDSKRLLEQQSLVTSAAESNQYIPPNLDYTEVINSVKKEEGIQIPEKSEKTADSKVENSENISISENLSLEQLLSNADTEEEQGLEEEDKEMRLMHFRNALEFYKEALKSDEENLSAMLGAGIMYTFIGKKGDAKNVLMRAYATYPENPSVHKALGDYSFYFSEYNNAIEYYNLSLLSGNLKDYATNLSTAVCYEKLGDIENAIIYYQVALQLNPESEFSKNRLLFYEERKREGYSSDSRVQESQSDIEDSPLNEEEIEKLIIKTHKIK